jgi:excinuclease ABC subunit A
VKLRRTGDMPAKSIADVLDLTVAEAREFFADVPAVARALRPLTAVGLDYLSLGQPVPTLSGGEAQRLKLAGFLAKAGARKSSRGGAKRAAGQAGAAAKHPPGTLFIFDEPTTGLHFADVAKLLGAFEELIADGHSVVLVEHHLALIQAADWIVDLGPEGGEAGGEVVAVGPPAAIAAAKQSRTGQVLRELATSEGAGTGARGVHRGPRGKGRVQERGASRRRTAGIDGKSVHERIEVVHAREHNLKNLSVEIPRNAFTVVTGVSGSGKSTLAFDILFAEGQRRYLESLNAYARQFVEPASRADVDAVFGIPPTVAIEQRTSRGGRKSTVATLTETYHFLRLLFVKLGQQHCPDCHIPIEAQSAGAILARLMKRHRRKRVALSSPLVVARKGYYTDLAEWAAGKGYKELVVDGVATPVSPWPRLDRFKEHDIELPVGEVQVDARSEAELARMLRIALDFGKGRVRVEPVGAGGKAKSRKAGRKTNARSERTAGGTSPRRSGELYSELRACPSCARSFDELDPRLFSYNSKHGWCPSCFGTGLALHGFDAEQSGEEEYWRDASAAEPCRECDGRRLNVEANAVYFKQRAIADFAALSVEQALKVFKRLKLNAREREIGRDIVAELTARLGFLERVGLGYLTLDRAAPSLSGGEAQRIRLAAQLGSNLRGVCYILDEPTIGLHARDNQLLLDAIAELTGKGNTVVVVEHDEETICRADHVIDLGPGAGKHGGEVVATGTWRALMKNKRSATGRMLAAPEPELRAKARRTGDALEIRGADLHNLRNVNVKLPLGLFVCVTGVSGSGKSTLLRDVVHDNVRELLKRRRKRAAKLVGCKSIEGWRALDRVLEVDQTPIGKTPRSCPATYVGLWDDVRRTFAQAPEARLRGYTASRFSFNVAGGRCETCEGQGMKRIEMSFLPDVQVLCEHCRGARFNAETLEVTYRGKTIAEVLAMSIEEAGEFFAAHKKVAHALSLMNEVGLGYLTLGQPSPTLSGGEAQRIKLVTELAKARNTLARQRPERTLFVLDEPTIGLHMADVANLIGVLHRLVEAGHSVMVIEHDLALIAAADWVVDLGPEGGERGGRVVAQGAPGRILSSRASHTAQALAQLASHRRGG